MDSFPGHVVHMRADRFPPGSRIGAIERTPRLFDEVPVPRSDVLQGIPGLMESVGMPLECSFRISYDSSTLAI